MKRYIQHEDLKISHFTTRQWEHPVHNHNHFEIIFIHRGKGEHCLSGSHYPYSGPCLFLLAPSDTHHFGIAEETEFTFLKFTNVYLDIPQLLMDDHRRHAPLLEGSPEAQKAGKLVRLITEEWQQTSSAPDETVFFLIQALLSLIRRNIQTALPHDVHPLHAEKISAIINYLHSHIHSPEHTKLEHLAKQFGYSRHYLGIFFKEQTGMPIRDYVNRYRLQLIEQRLRYSSHSIKEISNEMGFTDQSHFNKFFKTHKGMSPSGFRDDQANTHASSDGNKN